MAPTGAGKTYLGLSMCQSALEKGGRVLFICDRKTLIDQTSATATGYGMPEHGIIQADNPRFDLRHRFQIASAQTMAVRGFSDDYGSRDVVVVDEVHTVHKPVEAFVKSTRAVVIGLSATPFTKGLGATYSRLINAATMAELTKLGVLTPLRVLSCKRPDMTGAKTTGGEWQEGEAGRRGMAIIGDIVTEWSKHASDRKTICFGATVDHCEAIVKQFTAAGVPARLFTGKTTANERADILREYRLPTSRLRVLVSVEALAKGFDVPDVSCVIDARPLRKSLSTFIQLVGRGLRSAPGKLDCLLLDHSGNVVRFASDFEDIYRDGLAELDAGEKLDKEARKEVKEHAGKPCPSCGFQPFARRCMACGFEMVRAPTVEHEHGTAVEFKLFGGESPLAKDRRDLYCQLATYVRAMRERRPRESDAGKEVAAKFREMTGEWPPRAWTFDGAPDTKQTPATLGKLHAMRIAWARSRR